MTTNAVYRTLEDTTGSTSHFILMPSICTLTSTEHQPVFHCKIPCLKFYNKGKKSNKVPFSSIATNIKPNTTALGQFWDKECTAKHISQSIDSPSSLLCTSIILLLPRGSGIALTSNHILKDEKKDE